MPVSRKTDVIWSTSPEMLRFLADQMEAAMKEAATPSFAVENPMGHHCDVQLIISAAPVITEPVRIDAAPLDYFRRITSEADDV